MSIWKRIRVGLKVASIGLKVAAGILKAPLGPILGKVADGIDQIEPQLPESLQHGAALAVDHPGPCGPGCTGDACDLEQHSALYRKRLRGKGEAARQ